MNEEPPPRRAPHRPRFPPLSLGLAAFVLSLTIALVNGFYALRGSEIVVQQPRSVLLYRDGEGDSSVLVLAVRVPMINTAASEHGDVLMDSSAMLGPKGPRFAFQAIVQPVLGSGDENKGCELLARCTRLPNLLVVEYPDAVADVAGGKAHVRTLAYGLTSGACTGSANCSRFTNFAQAVSALRGKPIDAAFALQLEEDGDRMLRCRTAPLTADLADYLADVGWLNLPCQRSI